MRPKPKNFLEKFRLTDGPLASDPSFGNNGAFLIPPPEPKPEISIPGQVQPVKPMYEPESTYALQVIVSDGEGWDHISVSLPHRCPTWDEMEYIKRLFFKPDECAMQLHPPLEDYIEVHPFCLHIWRPQEGTIPQPPEEMVGPR